MIACRALSAALKQMLGVQKVILDTRGELTHQMFVEWAGSILLRRSDAYNSYSK